MRFSLRRRQPVPPWRWPDSPPAAAFLRDQMEDVLAVEREGSRDGAVAYGGRLRLPPDQAVDRLRPRLAPYGYTPFLQRADGLDWIQALPLREAPPPSKLRVHVFLFLATALTTLLAGAFLSGVGPGAILARPARILAGLPFAASLLGILGVHELGHYALGRWRGMAVSLPYFLPLPPIPGMLMTGTLGAVIRLRGPARDRRALFDMAVAGPLAGLAVAIPVYAMGLRLSSVISVPEGMAVSGIQLGDSVLAKLIEWAVVGVLPKNAEILLHPVGLAGWFGFLVTVLNLIPAGQLDGGHIVYSLFGRRHALISRCAAGALLAMGVVFWSPTWLVWAFLIVAVMGVHHGPTMDDVTPLGPGRRLLGAVALVLLGLLLPPVPLSVH